MLWCLVKHSPSSVGLALSWLLNALAFDEAVALFSWYRMLELFDECFALPELSICCVELAFRCVGV